MPDDKTKRGSPDNKRLNKSEPYEMAYARSKAKKAAAKRSGASSKKTAAKKSTAKKTPARKTTAKKAAPKKTPSRRTPMDGSTPPPASREKRSPGAEKSVTNTAPPMKAREPDAIDLLVDDHLAAYACFKKYEKLADAEAPDRERKALADTVCRMLTVHTKIEEEIFYPAARKAGIEADLLDEADIEHASAKELIAQIESGSPGDDKFDARVTVLGEYIEHHVKEEHSEMFPKCRKSGMDLAGLRARMEARKAELEGGDAGADEPGESGDEKPGLLSRVTGGILGG